MFGICMFTFSFDKIYIYLEAYLVLMKIFVLMIFMFMKKNFHLLSLIALFHVYGSYMTFRHSIYLLFTHGFDS